MKNISLLFTVLIIGIFFNSCDQKVKEELPEVSKQPVQKTDDGNSFLEEYPNAKKMKEIDARLNPENSVESLAWQKQTKNGSETVQVVAYLNEDGLPMKITEYFIEGNYKPDGQRHYYLENNKMIGFMEGASIWLDSTTANYAEKRTIYNDLEPVITQVRYADNIDRIEGEQWKNIRQEHHSLEKVNKILAGADEFDPHFISVVKSEQLFLILGEPKPQTEERYTTAVRVDEMTPFITDLLDNLDKYKFRPVNLTFKVVGGNNLPEYRVLTDIAWKE
ncbi:hypothetical protein [Brumimicrobium mesophilum]|uniref:hypothetical protein n=1 Tax=Brumimicrobium mesophilum TaxID=392717 RepID=UPI00131BD37C|nr:hypothetical protein [Brumimicrobium mesophilum]